VLAIQSRIKHKIKPPDNGDNALHRAAGEGPDYRLEK
jgi:hypothetical protein